MGSDYLTKAVWNWTLKLKFLFFPHRVCMVINLLVHIKFPCWKPISLRIPYMFIRLHSQWLTDLIRNYEYVIYMLMLLLFFLWRRTNSKMGLSLYEFFFLLLFISKSKFTCFLVGKQEKKREYIRIRVSKIIFAFEGKPPIKQEQNDSLPPASATPSLAKRIPVSKSQMSSLASYSNPSSNIPTQMTNSRPNTVSPSMAFAIFAIRFRSYRAFS